MIKLVEVEYLTRQMRGVERRPWEVNPENVEQVRRLFPKWLKERHGIVVYECPAMDSSAMGNKTYMPRMMDALGASGYPAPKIYSPTGNCSDQEWVQDWVCIPRRRVRNLKRTPRVVRDRIKKAEDINHILDACFYFEDPHHDILDCGPPFRMLISGHPCHR